MKALAMGVGDKLIFDFELDFAGTLRCIPMIVRLKLDLCGIKLSLRQWSRFSRDEREALTYRPCGTAIEVPAYRAYLAWLIETRAGETPIDLPIDPSPDWADAGRVPGRLVDHVRGLGLPAPTAAAWSRLTTLQRFTLIKLTRAGHDNDNFAPALREFGLAVEAAPAD